MRITLSTTRHADGALTATKLKRKAKDRLCGKLSETLEPIQKKMEPVRPRGPQAWTLSSVVERETFNLRVLGSIPRGFTTISDR